MRVATTCNKDGFEKYGYRVLEGWKHWPVGTELWWYTEGFSLPKDKPDGIVEIETELIDELQDFKKKYANYKYPSYLYDVVRFSNKVFAACDAFEDHNGVGVWMDADCVTKKKIIPGYIEGHLRDEYLAMFKRKGMYTETGFWVMDCSHAEHRAFLATWKKWYEEGAFKNLANWTDCETLDATVRILEKAGAIKTVSLSGSHEKDMHPMAKSELGKYIDHTKGPRKSLGYSPESL
jgi:hypothetical protein